MPTSDERIMAALSHLFGPILSVIIWTTQKDKSAFVRFQALQALAFDLVLTFVSMAGVLCSMVVMIAFFAIDPSSAARDGPNSNFGAFFYAPFIIWLPLMPCLLITTAVRWWAAFQTLQGRDFRYPWLGQKVADFLVR